MKTLSITELKARKDAATLIHVLPEDHFECEHLPGAVNACVYEMVFLAKVAELVPDKGSPVIVYGAGGDSLDATTAAPCPEDTVTRLLPPSAMMVPLLRSIMPGTMALQR